MLPTHPRPTPTHPDTAGARAPRGVPAPRGRAPAGAAGSGPARPLPGEPAAAAGPCVAGRAPPGHRPPRPAASCRGQASGLRAPRGRRTRSRRRPPCRAPRCGRAATALLRRAGPGADRGSGLPRRRRRRSPLLGVELQLLLLLLLPDKRHGRTAGAAGAEQRRGARCRPPRGSGGAGLRGPGRDESAAAGPASRARRSAAESPTLRPRARGVPAALTAASSRGDSGGAVTQAGRRSAR